MQKVATRQPCGAVSLRCDAAQRDGAARPEGRELCTLSSATESHLYRTFAHFNSHFYRATHMVYTAVWYGVLSDRLSVCLPVCLSHWTPHHYIYFTMHASRGKKNLKFVTILKSLRNIVDTFNSTYQVN